MFESVMFTEMVEVLAQIDPASYNSAQATARIKVDKHTRVVVIMQNGLIASTGTLDLKIEQANAASGGTVKAITGKAITQLTDADDNKIRIIELLTSELDVNGGFAWIVVTATPATAASLLSLLVLGVDPKYAPVTQPASVVVTN